MEKAIFEKFANLKKTFGADEHKAVSIYEDAPIYDEDKLAELARLHARIMYGDEENKQPLISEFASLRDGMRPVREVRKIFLWNEGNMPAETEYTDNQTRLLLQL